MGNILRILICLFLLNAEAKAAPIVSDISSHDIAIHTAFSGTRLMVFGARNAPGDIVIVIRGPQKTVTVRRKERVAGMWINRAQERFVQQPLFYRVASSRPMENVRQYRLFEPLSVLPALDSANVNDNIFLQALRQQLGDANLYSSSAGEVEFMGNTLFKAEFDFPDNVPRGTYTAETYLFTDGRLTGMQLTPVQVYKVGTDAVLYEAARKQSFLYGLFAILLAVTLGVGANRLFQRF